MKRSLQEVVELAVFALIALLVGTGLVWLSGWLLSLAGLVLTWFAGLVWSLLRFLVPVAVVAGLVYVLVQFLTRSGQRVAGTPQEQPMTPPSPWSTPAPSGEATSSEEVVVAASTGEDFGATPQEPSDETAESKVWPEATIKQGPGLDPEAGVGPDAHPDADPENEPREEGDTEREDDGSDEDPDRHN